MQNQEITRLVLSAQGGNPNDFGKLVQRYSGLVTGIAYSVCGDLSRSEDIGQEAFIEGWKKLKSIREPARFSSWICTIARRRAIDFVRRDNARSTERLLSDPHDDNQNIPELKMQQEQEREWVWSKLERLPETYRETMVLFYRAEHSVAEVAVALDENEATIRQRLKRGRELLKSEFENAISKTLQETVPQSAFVAVVLASLPAFTSVAATATTVGAAATKASGTSGALGLGGVSLVGLSGALFGTLFGLAGGLIGTWNSWRNAEYESQQRFIIRTAIHYVIGFLIFSLLLGVLIGFRVQGNFSDGMYVTLLLGLLGVGFVCSGFWMFYGIRTYRRLEDEAKSAGIEPRPEVAQRLKQFRDQARVKRDDGSVGFEAFKWNPGGWFGGTLGSSCWMLPSSIVLFYHRDWMAGGIVLTCLVVAVACIFLLWNYRSKLKALYAFQIMFGILFVLAVISLAAFQFLAGPQSQTALSWNPLLWFVVLIYPAMSLQFYFIERSVEKQLIAQDQPNKN